MRAVSVYRVGAAGADPSHVFGSAVSDADLPRAAWLGWLPLTTVDFAGPDIAIADDPWLTAPQGRSEGRCVRPGDVVSAVDAGGELLVRRECGLEAYTVRPGDLLPGGRLWDSSVAGSVADDIAAQVGRLRTAHETMVACFGAVDEDFDHPGGGQSATPGDSLVRQRYARAVRDLQDEQFRLHRLLEAVVRMGVFGPAAVSGEPRGVGRLA